MFKEKLARAQAAYAEKLGLKLEELASLVAQAHLKADPHALAAAQQLTHKICGSAGTFGFSIVSEMMSLMDQQLLLALGGKISPTPEFWSQLESSLAQSVASLKKEETSPE
jgi:chemotaxis protein histidine kinase CheA